MKDTKTPLQVASTNAGDGGEAVAKSQELPLKSIPNGGLEKPDDAGWYVAVVRVNCEVRIADSIRISLNRDRVWFDYWIPKIKVHYIDKRTNKRRVKEKLFLTTFIFCNVSRKHLNDIRFRPDVYKMLTMPGQRAIYQIPDSTLVNFRYLVENDEEPVSSSPVPLRKGLKVRVTAGNMKGLEAYVQRYNGKKAIIGNEIKYISGATIEINRALLEVVEE